MLSASLGHCSEKSSLQLRLTADTSSAGVRAQELVTCVLQEAATEMAEEGKKGMVKQSGKNKIIS